MDGFFPTTQGLEVQEWESDHKDQSRSERPVVVDEEGLLVLIQEEPRSSIGVVKADLFNPSVHPFEPFA